MRISAKESIIDGDFMGLYWAWLRELRLRIIVRLDTEWS
jgi:hypothetical protein